MSYALVFFLENHTEIINTFHTLQNCLNESAKINGVCIEISLLNLLHK